MHSYLRKVCEGSLVRLHILELPREHRAKQAAPLLSDDTEEGVHAGLSVAGHQADLHLDDRVLPLQGMLLMHGAEYLTTGN